MSSPSTVVGHLTPERWEQANRQLVRKALAEFAHERLIVPSELPDGRYVVRSDDGSVEYHFAARVLSLFHWHLDAASITRRRLEDGEELPLDALELVLDLREALSLTDDVLPVYLEEISSTLASSAYKLSQPPVSALELAQAPFQAVESGMTEGHPCFVANNGRLGFSAVEYLEYAPEAGRPIRLLWLAVRRSLSTFTSCRDVTYEQLVRSEFSEATLSRFASVLESLGLSLDDYHLFPVHPWQWWNRLSVTFAAEVAARNLVCVGYSDDEYQPQQSIRTFFNVSTPDRHYVKTALSVLNMGFVRGLSAGYMKGTPAINDWVADLIANDSVLKQTGVSVLRERAAIGYHNRYYERAATKGSPYLKMLAALWRESPIPSLGPGDRLATMASLLHVDRFGSSVVAAHIARSGLAASAWLRRYLDAYLKPLLHCFYAHDLVFMPHGENVILVLDEVGVPLRVVLKDIGEEIGVMHDRELPEEVERVRATGVPDDLKTLSIFTDVFDCFFRFLAAILETSGTLDQESFWAEVASCVSDYQESVPELAEQFARCDLFLAEFKHSCLNRLQLRNNQRMLDFDNPDVESELQFAGTLPNPLYSWSSMRASRPSRL